MRAVTMFMLIVLVAFCVWGDATRNMTYQGKLTDVDSIGYNDTFDIAFDFYNAETGGSLLDSYTALDVVVERGLFAAEIPLTLEPGEPFGAMWLEISIDGAPLADRQHITAEILSFGAIYADTAAFMIADDVAYDNAVSGLTATDVQNAIDELAATGGSSLQNAYDLGNAITGDLPVIITENPGQGRAMHVLAGNNGVSSNNDAALYVRNDSTGPAIYSAGNLVMRVDDFIGTNGNVQILLDMNNNTDDDFQIFSGDTTLLFNVNEDGFIEGNSYIANDSIQLGGTWRSTWPAGGSGLWTDHATNPYIYADNQNYAQLYDTGEDIGYYFDNDGLTTTDGISWDYNDVKAGFYAKTSGAYKYEAGLYGYSMGLVDTTFGMVGAWSSAVWGGLGGYMDGQSYAAWLNGRVRITGVLEDSDGDAGTAGQVLSSTTTGTDWITGGTGGVGGSGTDNYIPRWNGTSDLENSNIYQSSGGNIGIGTSAPVDELHIIRSSAEPVYLRFTNTSTGHTLSDGFKIGINGSGSAFIYQLKALDIIFGTDNTNRVVIKDDGDVGIGTTSPSELFHVDGNTRIEGGLHDGSGFGGSGDVLTADGAGNFSWQPAGAGSGLWTDHATNPYIYADNQNYAQLYDMGEDIGYFFNNDGLTSGDGTGWNYINVKAGFYGLTSGMYKYEAALYGFSTGLVDTTFGVVGSWSSSVWAGLGGYMGSQSYAAWLNGRVRITEELEDSDGDAGTAGQVLSSTGSGTDWITSGAGSDNDWNRISATRIAPSNPDDTVFIGTLIPDGRLNVEANTGTAIAADMGNTSARIASYSSNVLYGVDASVVGVDTTAHVFDAYAQSQGSTINRSIIGVSATANSDNAFGNLIAVDADAYAVNGNRSIAVSAIIHDAGWTSFPVGQADDIALFANSDNQPNSYAGYFMGPVRIEDTLALDGDAHIDGQVYIGDVPDAITPDSMLVIENGLVRKNAAPSLLDSSDFIWNQTATTQSAGFKITGNSYIGYDYDPLAECVLIVCADTLDEFGIFSSNLVSKFQGTSWDYAEAGAAIYASQESDSGYSAGLLAQNWRDDEDNTAALVATDLDADSYTGLAYTDDSADFFNLYYINDETNDRWGYLGGNICGAYFSHDNADGATDDNYAHFAAAGSNGAYIYQSYSIATNTYGLYVSADNDSDGYADGSASIYAYRSGQGIGSNYGKNEGRYAVKGYTLWGSEYCFGLGGYRYDDTEIRTGGVIGGSSHDTTPDAWGSLGYRNSSSTHCGVYGSNAYATGAGLLRVTDGGIGEIHANVAVAGAGDLFGSWFRGEIYGTAIKGDRFALYSDGDEYTTGIRAVLVDDDREDKAIGYEVISPDISVQTAGMGQLIDGKAEIAFPKSFHRLIENGSTPIVTVSPFGQPCNIYVAEIDENGFTIKTDALSSDVRFSWIAIGIRRGSAEHNVPAEIIPVAFDNHLDKFMFNDSRKDANAEPIWWDGSSLRYEPIPEESQEVKNQQKLNDPAYLEDQRMQKEHEEMNRRMRESAGTSG